MRLLLIRHGIAETRERFARSGEGDDRRPLTRDGRRRMRRAARGLRELVPAIDTLLTSPLVRARQTADVVARTYGRPAPTELEALRPERPPDELLHWLRRELERGEATIALVGHDPHLSTLLTWLVTGQRESWLGLRKGGACLVEFRGLPEAGAGEIRWLAAPKVLRRLATRRRR
jgi:phosphohistidine phosphatase